MDNTDKPEPVGSTHNFSEYGKLGGRPKYVPTTKLRREIEAFASYGATEEIIARVVGIPLSTMRKHYRDELDLGHAKANAQVAGFLFAAAKKGSVPAMMFWLKCRARWSEPRTDEQPGKKELALQSARQPEVYSPLSRMTAERDARNVGSELSGLGGSDTDWPIAHSKPTAQ
jgi:hypothetical protein